MKCGCERGGAFVVRKGKIIRSIFAGSLSISEEDRASILAQLDENPFVTLHKEFSTYYKIDKHVRNSPAFRFIEPKEVKLPPKDDGVVPTFQYISVIDTVAAVVSDPGFKNAEHSDDDSVCKEVLCDLKDGSVWRENLYFQQNKDALALLFYSDELEVCNPLGPSKGVHKVLHIYFTLADIPKRVRSKTDNFFLALSVRSKDLKDNRLAVYKPLLDDLHKLEQGVKFGERLIKAGVLAHLADNLEAGLLSLIKFTLL
jgi:hypothetical protein